MTIPCPLCPKILSQDADRDLRNFPVSSHLALVHDLDEGEVKWLMYRYVVPLENGTVKRRLFKLVGLAAN